jgi:hypothetical protein
VWGERGDVGNIRLKVTYVIADLCPGLEMSHLLDEKSASVNIEVINI